MQVTATTGRYIKLGSSGKWEQLCLQDGTLRLGYYEAPHSPAVAGDKEAIKAAYAYLDGSVASDNARQVLQFYDPSDTVIWITFADGFLWWCKAAPEVEYFGNDRALYTDGSRLRRAIDGWSNRTLQGKPLRMMELKGELTKTSAYRKTICDLKPHLLAYLLRKINDEALPEIIAAQQAMNDLQVSMRTMIAMLHWRDFELLVELIFSHSGWQRVSVVGETMKTTDIELRLPITSERAMVQIKSETTQAEFNEYLTAFERWEMQRLFYIYHTAKVPLISGTHDPRVTLIGPDQLASLVLRAGLVEWVMEKAG
ncbi:MAG: hypothetical protein SFW64_00545 [Alphaproteobacteria bacterium]|nr:hypothetical protein [Alphaproteobacteria bacterium]